MRRNYFYMTKKRLRKKERFYMFTFETTNGSRETSSGLVFLQMYPSAAGYINFPGKV